MSGCAQLGGKKVIGETARISLVDSRIEYLARIDTGARVTSLHGLDVQVENAEPEKRDNIGKTIRFSTENERGERRAITTKIVDVSRVRNAQGVEYRYVVELDLDWNGLVKGGQVNLRDRSAMSYKLLIGRNWLQNDFVVDVDESEGIIE